MAGSMMSIQSWHQNENASNFSKKLIEQVISQGYND